MKTHRRLFIAVGICTIILFGGTLGYMLLEDYSFFQGIYMSVITISTVGYGEVKPLSPMGQGFSILLIFCSFAGLALASRTLGESLLVNLWSGQTERRQMRRKISSLQEHYVICGYGRVGRAAVTQFVAARVPFVVLDQDLSTDHEGKEEAELFIEGDATREQILLDAGIKKAHGLLALLGSDPENVFLVLTAREMNPTLRIIARASDPSVENKLHRAGADTVISPFTTAGTQIANDMLIATGKLHTMHTCMDTISAPQWYTLMPDDPLIGACVEEAASQKNGSIIGLRRGRRDKIMPAAGERVKAGDALLIISGSLPLEAVSREYQAERQVVIIDDNPVIIKLYTRLFKKAGFIPHTATDGKTGLELVERYKPQAAVIDFMLPVLSGIEICKQIRRNSDLDHTRLILFTADDNDATRRRAISSGADAVVVKSPEAQEVIQTVVKIISEKNG